MRDDTIERDTPFRKQRHGFVSYSAVEFQAVNLEKAGGVGGKTFTTWPSPRETKNSVRGEARSVLTGRD